MTMTAQMRLHGDNNGLGWIGYGFSPSVLDSQESDGTKIW